MSHHLFGAAVDLIPSLTAGAFSSRCPIGRVPVHILESCRSTSAQLSSLHKVTTKENERMVILAKSPHLNAELLFLGLLTPRARAEYASPNGPESIPARCAHSS